MWILSIFLACFTLLKDATANSTVCKEDQNYICTKFAGLTVNTFVITKDTHLCEGHCSVRTILCNDSDSNSWSEWSPASLLLSSFNFSNPNVVFGRSRSCASKQKDEVEIKLELNASSINTSSDENVFIRSKRFLPKELKKFIAKKFKMELNVRLIRNVGGSIFLSCDNEITRAVVAVYKKSSSRWLLNNHALKIEAERMIYQFDKLRIQNIKPEDQGVYACQIEYEKNVYKTVAVFTLFTTQGIKVKVKDKMTLKLSCPTLSLYHVTKDPKPKRFWYFNGTQVLPPISILNRSEEVFENVNETYTGNWTCEVPDNKSNVIWKVIKYDVFVDTSFNYFEIAWAYIKEDPRLFGACALAILAPLMVCITCCAYYIDKNKNEEDEKLKEFKRNLFKMKDDEEVVGLMEAYLPKETKDDVDEKEKGEEEDNDKKMITDQEMNPDQEKDPDKEKDPDQAEHDGFLVDQDFYLGDENHYLDDGNHFLEDGNYYPDDENYYLEVENGNPEDENYYLEDQKYYPEDQNYYMEDHYQYPIDQTQYPVDQGQYGIGQEQYPMDQGQYLLDQGEYSIDQSQYPLTQNVYANQLGEQYPVDQNHYYV